MKKIVAGFIAIFGLLLLANCTTQTNVSQNVKRDWMLVEFQGFTKDSMMSNKAHLNLSDQKEPGKFSANMGCNNMFGSAVFNANGTVKFSQIGSTMMFCDKAMDLESTFAKALPTMTSYKIDGHYLTLSNASGKKMKFVAADWD
ncbi:META domain-containing protein [Kaistella flava (ex Peng et al. 2021)]|uniref:META domain-containing protein n=1 Tax=Kaistella flava (ex Peng et al. 2021) TaxID=2038776 RepID=A0A7M2YA61_9FLAO|nr:META domain-containing protein [Kaistella flava (ex Peng et al. 2021)]QOW11051.1 META domain-containing protein [Kaistella flava (ex Peng et al. 2021)]